jgi:hypothetical protein
VPYGSGAFSDPTGSIFNVPVEGSAKLDAQATAIGAPSRFYTWRGTGHAPYSTNTAFRDTTIRFVTRHLYEWVCDQPPLHVLRSKQDVSCPNGADGQLSIKPRNGTPPYTIQWADTASNDTLRSGLAPGTYVVTVTDSSGLDRRDSITLTAPSPINSIGIPTAASGPDASDGSINLIVNGGNGDYSYSWSNGDTVQDPQGLPPGTYSVTITDAEGCTATDTFSIGTTTARPRDQAPAQLRLAPNPSDGRVRLSFAKPVRQARVSVLNAQGQQLWQKRVSGPSAQLSLAGQPAGVYLLRISTPRQQYVRRLMLR